MSVPIKPTTTLLIGYSESKLGFDRHQFPVILSEIDGVQSFTIPPAVWALAIEFAQGVAKQLGISLVSNIFGSSGRIDLDRMLGDFISSVQIVIRAEIDANELRNLETLIGALRDDLNAYVTLKQYSNLSNILSQCALVNNKAEKLGLIAMANFIISGTIWISVAQEIHKVAIAKKDTNESWEVDPKDAQLHINNVSAELYKRSKNYREMLWNQTESRLSELTMFASNPWPTWTYKFDGKWMWDKESTNRDQAKAWRLEHFVQLWRSVDAQVMTPFDVSAEAWREAIKPVV